MKTSTRTAAIAAGVLAADLGTKALAGHASCGPAICSLPNEGLMLGIGGAHVSNTVAASLFGLVVFTALLAVVGDWRRDSECVVGAGLAFGGILANLADRVLTGKVHDFLVLPFGIVANLADVAIFVGSVACLRRAYSSLARLNTSEGGELT